MSNRQGTTTDQKLTCDEVCAEATSLGFREVQVFDGWVKLEKWQPYGKREHKAICFCLETMNHQPMICERALGWTDKAFVFGAWPIR